MNKYLAISALAWGLFASWGVSSTLAAEPKRGEIGTAAPAWENLQGVDGKKHSLKDFEKSKVLVLTFTCNHCPVAQSYDQRFIDFVKQNKERSVSFLAISCSDFEDDSYDEMKKHAQARQFNFPYLHDADQSVGYRIGAERTPHCFVLDEKRNIIYSGGFDDDWTSQEIKHHYVQDAVDAALAGKKPAVEKTKSTGCPIDYPRKLRKS